MQLHSMMQLTCKKFRNFLTNMDITSVEMRFLLLNHFNFVCFHYILIPNEAIKFLMIFIPLLILRPNRSRLKRPFANAEALFVLRLVKMNVICFVRFFTTGIQAVRLTRRYSLVLRIINV